MTSIAERAHHWLREALETQDRSPVRRLASASEGPTALRIQLESLNRLSRDLQQVAQSLYRPLNLVVMGEVKAGKSTLVNALVRQAVAPTDVLEATASIMEVYHSEAPAAEILFLDGTRRTFSVDALKAYLNEHRNDQELASRIDVIRVGVPMMDLHLLLVVDTPGLLSVTEANQQRTEQYLTQAHVILWVMSALHPDRSDVQEFVADVCRRGKPVILLVNRIDSIDPRDRRRLVDRIEDLYLGLVDTVIPISALQAFEAQQAGDDRLLEESGLPELRRFLEAKVLRDVSSVQVESVVASAEELLRAEIDIHESCTRVLSELQGRLQALTIQLKDAGDRVAGQVESSLVQEAGQLFSNEEQLLSQALHEGASAFEHAAGSLSLDGALKSWLQSVQPRLPEQLRVLWQHELTRLQRTVEMELQQLGDAVQREASQIAEALQRLQSESFSPTLNLRPISELAIAETLSQGSLPSFDSILQDTVASLSDFLESVPGTVVAAGIGALFAGPVGAIVGLVGSRLIGAIRRSYLAEQRDSTGEQMRVAVKSVHDSFERARAEVVDQVVKQRVVPLVLESVNRVVEEYRERIVLAVAGTHAAELEGLSRALANHINDLNIVLWKSPLRVADNAEFGSSS